MESVFDSYDFNANLFFPRTDSSPPPLGTDEIYIEVEESICVHARRFPQAAARFSLLYFHGNGEIVADYNDLATAFSGLGAELTVCDYRGYGKSGGTPSLRTVLKDTHGIYRHLNENGNLRKELCVMGRSLGSAPAIELCVHFPQITACVIESGYADPIPLVERRGFRIDKTTPEEDALFNNSKKISQITCPLLIMHGEDDYLISSQEAQLNYQQAGSRVKFLQILEGVGHNDMMLAPEGGYFSCLKKFFDSIRWNAG